MVMKKDEDKIKFSELPEVTTLIGTKHLANMVIGLLEEADALTKLIADHETRLEEVKCELETMQADSHGFKHNNLCFVARQMPGRETLDKVALIENGVDLDVLKKSIKIGKSYVERRFKNVDKLVKGTA